MIAKWRRWLKEQEGSTLVLVAFMMAGLMAMAAVVADGGKVYVVKSHLQKTANAAVLSGAQELTNTQAKVDSVVQETLRQHNELSNLTASSVVMGSKVTVQLRKEVPVTFLKLIGMNSAQVDAKATAEISTMGEAEGAAPLGIDESIPLVYGQEYKLKVDQTDVSYGNFGILALGGSGAATYEDNLKYGYKNMLKVGQVIETQTGNVTDKTREGVKSRIEQCPNLSGDYTLRDCARIILVPVFKPVNLIGNQVKQVEIRGFAYFYIKDPMNMLDKTISGFFVKRAGTGIVNPNATFRGAYAIRLTE